MSRISEWFSQFFLHAHALTREQMDLYAREKGRAKSASDLAAEQQAMLKHKVGEVAARHIVETPAVTWHALELRGRTPESKRPKREVPPSLNAARKLASFNLRRFLERRRAS